MYICTQLQFTYQKRNLNPGQQFNTIDLTAGREADEAEAAAHPPGSLLCHYTLFNHVSARCVKHIFQFPSAIENTLKPLKRLISIIFSYLQMACGHEGESEAQPT
ncbi:hypothetical protein J6590_098865 [Homalodisca vitripennis]|nr:hypothetical protein J6590_098865 [Homalodisca vitripennis]